MAYLLGIERPDLGVFAAGEFLTSGQLPDTVARPSRTLTGFHAPPRLTRELYRLGARGDELAPRPPAAYASPGARV
jgi:hypothetical protein